MSLLLTLCAWWHYLRRFLTSCFASIFLERWNGNSPISSFCSFLSTTTRKVPSHQQPSSSGPAMTWETILIMSSLRKSSKSGEPAKLPKFSLFGSSKVFNSFYYDLSTDCVEKNRLNCIWLFFLTGGSVTASAQFSSSLRFSFDRMASMTAFNASSEANEMLKGLRYFEKTSKLNPDKKAMSWGEVNKFSNKLFSILFNFFYYYLSNQMPSLYTIHLL